MAWFCGTGVKLYVMNEKCNRKSTKKGFNKLALFGFLQFFLFVFKLFYGSVEPAGRILIPEEKRPEPSKG